MKLCWHPFCARLVGLAALCAMMLAFPCAGPGKLSAAEAAPFHRTPFAFRTNDVIAFVGGEDVVEMQHNGYLELLLTTALPHHKLHFRNLAFEGDTVFEQHRQLNFPSWEKQLEQVGATVVIAQFGQAESLQGTNEVGKFVEAYGKLLDRFTNGGRRLVIASPTPFAAAPGFEFDADRRNAGLRIFVDAMRSIANRNNREFVDLFSSFRVNARLGRTGITRDGLHLNWTGHFYAARSLTGALRSFPVLPPVELRSNTGVLTPESLEHLRQLILEKNRLWFDYWRPQNWAFLRGDRTEQPSSHDHRDPKKRWFPEEMEKFLPLIEAKEREIWKLAQELATK